MAGPVWPSTLEENFVVSLMRLNAIFRKPKYLPRITSVIRM